VVTAVTVVTYPFFTEMRREYGLPGFFVNPINLQGPGSLAEE
ncbi:MAG: hypothetical protein HW416_3348, partial [Chloroflexi bacterium]|nr:hypothetical protein [Chloroflexota bacterium]